MTERAYDVARYLRTKSLNGELQMQKLLYYVQGWSLAWTGKPAFVDGIEAWQNGPVVRSMRFTWPSPVTDAVPDSLRAIIDAVYTYYGRFNGAQLADRTHHETPWIEAWGDRGPRDTGDDPIENAALLRFFTKAALTSDPSQLPSPPSAAPASVESDVDEVLGLARGNSQKWRRTLALLAE